MRADRTAQAGFTLIEMIIALGIFGLAATALVRLEGMSIRSAQAADASIIGQMVASNVAVEALTDERPPAFGSSSGVADNGGRQWSWTRTAAPLGDQGAERIEIVVRDARGVVRGHLVTVRPPPTTRVEAQR